MAKNKIHLDIDSLTSITDTTSQNVSTLQGQASSADTHIAAINNPHGVTANQVSAYTKIEVDNLISGVVEDLDWKEMVGTFADLAISYPEPDEGWTASVAADNITYRYDGTDWVPIMGSLSPLATENNNGLLSSTDFTKLGTIESGAQQDQNAVEVPYDNEESTLVSTNVQVAIDELDSKKLNANALNATLVLFATDAASDLANHFKLVSSVEDADYNTTAVNIPTPSITGTDQNVSNLISEPGLITGNPGVITISTIGQIRKISGNTQQNARFRYRVFKRDAADNEVELAVSDATSVVQSATYEEFFAFALLNNGQFAATDRIVVRYFADVDGNDGAIYQFQFGGTNPVRTLLPVPVQVLVAASEATNTIVNAQAFDTVLSPSDTTVQAALNTLDDHLHDNDYYQQDVLNPLIDFGFGGGPQANFNTFAPLDQRYGNVNQVFENSFRLATSEFNNLWQQGAFSKFGSPQNILDVANFLDNRIDESDPGIDFPSGTDTLAAASWTEVGSTGVYSQTIIIPGTSTQDSEFLPNSQAGFGDFYLGSLYGGSEFTIDTLTSGPVVITRVSGADFQSDLKGLPLQLNTQDFTGFGQISITEFVDADTLNGNLQFAQNLVDFTYQMNNTAFLNLPMGINQQNQLQLFGGQIGQQNFNYDYPYYVSLFPPTNTTYTEIDFEAISGVRYAALESFQNGTKFLAITLSDGPFSGSNEIAFISTDQGVRQITRINNGVFQTNNAAIYGDEDWVDIPSGAFGIFGGGFGLTVSYAVHIQPTNRATLPMWEDATVFPDISNFTHFGVHAGISLSENDQFFAQTVWSGIVLEVVKPAVQVTSQTPVFVDLEIDETSITSITNISDAWASVKYAEVNSVNEITFFADEDPTTDIPIQWASLKKEEV